MRHESLVFKRVGEIRRSEVVAAFTYALDLTEGQPPGHSIRSCFIATMSQRPRTFRRDGGVSGMRDAA